MIQTTDQFSRQAQMVDPNVLFFAIGMGIVLFITYAFAFRSKDSEEKEWKNLDTYSAQDYQALAEKNRDLWQSVSRNNRLYLGALILSFGLQKFGQYSAHPVFGSDLVISMTYLIAFTTSFKHLIKSKPSDSQIISSLLRGLQLEQKHPEWRVDYFRQSLEDYKGMSMVFMVFFRVVLLSWLLFCALDFGVMSRISSHLPVWGNVLASITILGVTAAFLWKIGCQPYHYLRARSKEMMV